MGIGEMGIGEMVAYYLILVGFEDETCISIYQSVNLSFLSWVENDGVGGPLTTSGLLMLASTSSHVVPSSQTILSEAIESPLE